MVRSVFVDGRGVRSAAQSGSLSHWERDGVRGSGGPVPRGPSGRYTAIGGG